MRPRCIYFASKCATVNGTAFHVPVAKFLGPIRNGTTFRFVRKIISEVEASERHVEPARNFGQHFVSVITSNLQVVRKSQRNVALAYGCQQNR